MGQWLYIGLRFSFFCNVDCGDWSSPLMVTLNNSFHNSTYNYCMGFMCSRAVGSFLAQLIHWLLPSRADITGNYRSFLILNLAEMAELSPDSPGQKRNNDHITPKRKFWHQQGSPSGCAVVKSQPPETLSHGSQLSEPDHQPPSKGPGFSVSLFFILHLSTSHNPHLGGRGAPFCLMWAKCPGAVKGLSGGNSCQLQ